MVFWQVAKNMWVIPTIEKWKPLTTRCGGEWYLYAVYLNGGSQDQIPLLKVELSLYRQLQLLRFLPIVHFILIVNVKEVIPMVPI